MDPTVLVALITAAGVVLAGVVTLLGVRYTQRQIARAGEATARLESTKVDAQAYQHARATWQEHVDWLGMQVVELRLRVDELEDGQTEDHRRIRELTDYARRLLRILGEHNIAYPPPPAGLD